ncbi:MAG: DedA family protein [Actinomycetales bacterium]
MGGLLEIVDVVQTWMIDLAASPWVLLIVLAGCVVDGFFPAAPSEGVVIAAAALTAAGEGPHLDFLWPVAAVGAFVGDQIAYWIGTKIPLHRIPVLSSARGQKAVAVARRTLGRRGAALLLAARFIPLGRVAVNMTSGAVSYPRTRFRLLTGIAAIVWATYSVALGFGAGAALAHQPLLGVAVGVVGGFLLGVLLERVLGWAQGRLLPRLWPERAGDGAWAESDAEVPEDGSGTAAPEAVWSPEDTASPDAGEDGPGGSEADPRERSA